MHLTLDMAGATKFGPDVQWVDGEEYAVDPVRAERFYPAIRTYYPGLRDGALAPSYSGALLSCLIAILRVGELVYARLRMSDPARYINTANALICVATPLLDPCFKWHGRAILLL